ncbi:Outer membrane protein beta-barrel domain-containing protein [Chitinophaga sp. CF118]|uniref:porin family protein n=1 Tax=Chitinophaga sp. CF118 TaxID=1884367 RepID=UPI0008E47993|nr:porin family protein [Chitinophaga sp. CF118]SFD98364.1 Outer membrane protein beta-barrel domain-containing protein [Chitinophaga sp. CF118]
MKKLLFVCLVLALASTNGYSQSLLKRLSFGLKAGANYSNYSNADFATDPLVGFHAGALVNFKITDHLSIQEEFLFSTQGAKAKGGTFGDQDLKVSYITVPFLLKYRTNFGLYFEAGPQVGLRQKEDWGDTKIDGEFTKKMDLAAAGGIGYQTPFGLGIGARYIYGLSTVGDFNIANVKTDFRTNVAQASIFYIF